MSAWDCFVETLKHPPARKHFIVLCVCLVGSIVLAVFSVNEKFRYMGLLACSIFAYNAVNGFSQYLIALRRYTLENPGKWKKSEKKRK